MSALWSVAGDERVGPAAASAVQRWGSKAEWLELKVDRAFHWLCLLLIAGLPGCQHRADTRIPPANVGQPSAADSFLGAKAGEEREGGGVKLCWCPPGRFRMGSPPDEPERRHDHIGFRVVAVRP